MNKAKDTTPNPIKEIIRIEYSELINMYVHPVLLNHNI